MSFFTPWFAVAGLAAAAGPILIHLLNRRRYRVVPWAAMEFLRQAVRRSRRILQLRDLILLVLRTACVILFGLALARPYLKAATPFSDPDQPVHAVLLIDNSLSMNFTQVDKTLLDAAKAKAKDLIERLPAGSRISVLPVCGSSKDFSLTGYATKDDALEALAAIETVDREAMATDAIDLALEACKRVDSPQSKQVVFISDQQVHTWPHSSLESQLKKLNCPLEIVQVAGGDLENAWIEDFHLQDGIGDVSTPAVFLATIRYAGAAARSNVQVSLTIDGVTVATQTVDLQPEQAREVRFPPYQFDVSAEPGRPASVTAEVSLSPHDRLAADDRRFLVVPVVAALPVVFVDQYGDDESPSKNRYGETYRLRRLLAPVTSEDKADRQWIQIRHVKIGRLDRDILADARLVVIGGINSPETTVPLLKEYVEQGGSLVITAGGDFDPAAWNDAAWDDGLGILPAPLKPSPVGQLPGSSAGPLKSFHLDFDSMHHDYFLLEQTSREDLRDLYKQPFFFKAIDADVSDALKERVVRAVTEKNAKDRKALAEVDQQLQKLAEKESRQSLSDGDRQQREQLRQTRASFHPQWLAWAAARGRDRQDVKPEMLRPEVLASFDNQVPFLIQRRIGRGQVLLATTGVFREWNTLTSTNAVLIFDRIFRSLLQASLPERNMASTGRLIVPVSDEIRRARFTLAGPSGSEEPISVDALSAEGYGLALSNITQRGIYRLTAYATKETPQSAADSKLWAAALAVNGPVDESELKVLDERGLEERLGQSEYHWVAAGQAISVAKAQVYGQDFWEWLMVAVMGALFLEIGILAWPTAMGGRAA